jgi:hypothetical protein
MGAKPGWGKWGTWEETESYLGDRITRTSRLVSIRRKTLRVGDGAFLRQEDTYTNQDDGTVSLDIRMENEERVTVTAVAEVVLPADRFFDFPSFPV